MNYFKDMSSEDIKMMREKANIEDFMNMCQTMTFRPDGSMHKIQTVEHSEVKKIKDGGKVYD